MIKKPKTEAQRARARIRHKKWLKRHPEKVLASIRRWVEKCPDDEEAKKCLKEHEAGLLAAIEKNQA